MGSFSRFGLGVTLLFAGASAAELLGSESDRSATLQAIHQLENPRNVRRPGPHGELGAYQFRVSTWRMHTTEPFSRALERDVSDEVAIRHYEWLKRGLAGAGRPVTPYMIALAWNGGLTAAISGRAPRAAHDYASRAANLAGVFRQHTLVATAASTPQRTGQLKIGVEPPTRVDTPVIRPTL